MLGTQAWEFYSLTHLLRFGLYHAKAGGKRRQGNKKRGDPKVLCTDFRFCKNTILRSYSSLLSNLMSVLWQRLPTRHHPNIHPSHTISISILIPPVLQTCSQPVISYLLQLSATHPPHNLTHDLAPSLTLKILNGTAHVSHLAQVPLGSMAQNAGRPR